MIMKENLAVRFSKWTAFAAILLGALSLPAFALKPADQPESVVEKSRITASSGQARDEYGLQMNPLMDEPLPASEQTVSQKAYELDLEKPITVPADEKVKQALPLEMAEPDTVSELSTNTKDFIIEVGDVLRIDVYKEPELSMNEVIVRPDGKISIPLISDIQAGGLTPMQLKERVEERLKDYVSSPVATVIVLQFRHDSASIIGNIKNPGVYPLDSSINVLELLARAGGFSQFANTQNIAIIRKGGDRSQHYTFNYKDAIEGNNLQNNIVLKNGDVVIVP